MFAPPRLDQNSPPRFLEQCHRAAQFLAAARA
jgi:hypothetical protein